jgi:ABC-type lipoprotein release transport system permease subunit
VSAARARIWGTVGSETLGAVTVIGVDAATAQALGLPPPDEATAHVGAGLAAIPGASITLHQLDGFPARPLTVGAQVPARFGAALHRAVLVHRATARALLKLGEGQASDLAIDVFHDSEQAAILPDLMDALPWPARAVTRAEAVGQTAAGAARRGSLTALAALPALLAIVALVLGVARDRLGRRAEVGLLKAMGWTTRDVVRLHLLRALWIGLPAVVFGLGLAYGLVRWPGVTWPGALLLGWTDGAPPLDLDADGALLVLTEVAALVGAPWLLASLWPALRAATADPGALLAEEDAR